MPVQKKPEDELAFRANNILPWQDSAHKLAYAANVLFKQYQVIWVAPFKENKPPLEPDCFYSSPRPVIMLYAYAIENLVKGILIATNTVPPLIEGKLNKELQTHKLSRLIRLAGFSLQAREHELLALLEQAASSGKYPIPVAPTEISAHQRAGALRDVNAVRELFGRLDIELRSVAPGETGPTLDRRYF